mmetsp:Transcript_34742/g.87933  ORF Transcript_34742/g.87933 Transcript_34742/m.87933 type:complete len:206 (-) Transcript_34742:968-1585(-)
MHSSLSAPAHAQGQPLEARPGPVPNLAPPGPMPHPMRAHVRRYLRALPAPSTQLLTLATQSWPQWYVGGTLTPPSRGHGVAAGKLELHAHGCVQLLVIHREHGRALVTRDEVTDGPGQVGPGFGLVDTMCVQVGCTIGHRGCLEVLLQCRVCQHGVYDLLQGAGGVDLQRYARAADGAGRVPLVLHGVRVDALAAHVHHVVVEAL